MDDRFIHNRAVRCEWIDGELHLFDRFDNKINIYRCFDLEYMAIDNHNKYLARK